MNYIWSIIIILGIIYMVATGQASQILSSISKSGSSAVELCISLTGIYCFWLGIMNIAKESGLIEKLSSFVSPLLKKLFKGTGKEAFSFISMNIAANMLGLGNAATPFGLSAMEALQKNNPQKEYATNSMIMFIILNTSSLQLIPTTVLSLRGNMGANDPTSIVITSLITSVLTVLLGIFLCKSFEKSRVGSIQ